MILKIICQVYMGHGQRATSHELILLVARDSLPVTHDS